MWNLPGPGIKPVSPVLAGGLLTTGLPRKSILCPVLTQLLVPLLLQFSFPDTPVTKLQPLPHGLSSPLSPLPELVHALASILRPSSSRASKGQDEVRWSPRSPWVPGSMLFRVLDIWGIILYYSLLPSFPPPSHLFFFFWLCLTRIEPWPPALGVQGLNPWTTRDVLFLFLSFFSPLPSGLWDLSSPTRDSTWALGSKSLES